MSLAKMSLGQGPQIVNYVAGIHCSRSTNCVTICVENLLVSLKCCYSDILPYTYIHTLLARPHGAFQSDHDIVCATVRVKNQRQKPTYITTRSFKHYWPDHVS